VHCRRLPQYLEPADIAGLATHDAGHVTGIKNYAKKKNQQCALT
jgi:hypothetical protein